MGLFKNLFSKNKNTIKIKSEYESCLVYMQIPKRSVKLKSKIIVPENFCVVVLSKEKLLDIMPSGEHELNGFTMPKTCKINKLDKPTKKGYKKDFKADFYFVNLNVCKITNKFFIKRFKLNVDFVLNFKIVKAEKFLKFLISERIVFNQNFAVNFLSSAVTNVLYYYFFDNKNIEKEKMKYYIEQKLKTIGIEVLGFDIEYFEEEDTIKNNSNTQSNENLDTKKQNLKENYTKNSENLRNNKYFDNENDFKMFENDDKKINNYNNDDNFKSKRDNKTQATYINQNYNFDNFDDKKVDNYLNENDNYNYYEKNEENADDNYNDKFKEYKKNSLINLDEIKTESISYFVCDECGAKLPATSKVCYNCKKSFEEKHCCENCGREIKKGVYVCPYCNCVLIN